MRKQWRCFHCNEVFTNERCAAEHFGAREDDISAACKIRAYEGHLITYIRKLEDRLGRYQVEDSDIMRSIMTMEADHRQALIRAEEEGYAKGIRDMRTPLARAG